MRRRAFGLLLILLSSVCFGQVATKTGSIYGKVLDEKRSPLPGVDNARKCRTYRVNLTKRNRGFHPMEGILPIPRTNQAHGKFMFVLFLKHPQASGKSQVAAVFSRNLGLTEKKCFTFRLITS